MIQFFFSAAKGAKGRRKNLATATLTVTILYTVFVNPDRIFINFIN